MFPWQQIFLRFSAPLILFNECTKFHMILTSDYNNNQWCSVVYRSYLTNGGHFDTRKKSLETRSEAECF